MSERVQISYGASTPVVMIQFPGREPFHIWDYDELVVLCDELNRIAQRWERKLREAANVNHTS